MLKIKHQVAYVLNAEQSGHDLFMLCINTQSTRKTCTFNNE